MSGNSAAREAMWAERDRKRAEFEAEMDRRREADRQRHITIVEQALDRFDCVGGMPWDEVAAIAVDALLADGVVFARMGSWADDSGRVDRPASA